MSGFAEIWNLDDANSWAAGGTDAKPRLAFTVSDPDGDSIASIILRIYTASAGGSPAITHTLTGADLTAAIANGYYDSSYGMLNKDQASCERWWTIEVTDSMGESSGESSRTGFKVCWGQIKLDYTVPSGASSSGWAFSNAALTDPANTKAAFLFRARADSTDSGAWSTSIGSLTPNTHLHVLVRLSTRTAGTNPSLSDFTFTYNTSVSSPDNWTASGGSIFSLDPSTYRYGTKSLKFAGSSDCYIYPFRVTAGDDIPVLPNTNYVFSCWVLGSFASAGSLHNGVTLEIYSAGGATQLAVGTAEGDAYNDGPGKAQGLTVLDVDEGWRRIHLRYKTGSETAIRPRIHYQNVVGGANETGFIDAALLEEGLVVSPWHPNVLANSSVLDAYGLILDALAGARVYARASDGATANLDQIVHAAAGGGGGGSPNLDGGLYNSTYGGTTAVDGGAP